MLLRDTDLATPPTLGDLSRLAGLLAQQLIRAAPASSLTSREEFAAAARDALFERCVAGGLTARPLLFFSGSKDFDDLEMGVPRWRKILSNFEPVRGNGNGGSACMMEVPGGAEAHGCGGGGGSAEVHVHDGPKHVEAEARGAVNYLVANGGRRYRTVEHAFQAAKFLHGNAAPAEVAERRAADFEVGGRIAADAKKAKLAGGRKGMAACAGGGCTLDRARWGAAADAVMVDALEARWAVDAAFRDVLRETRRQGIRLVHFERSGGKSYWGGGLRTVEREVGAEVVAGGEGGGRGISAGWRGVGGRWGVEGGGGWR